MPVVRRGGWEDVPPVRKRWQEAVPAVRRGWWEAVSVVLGPGRRGGQDEEQFGLPCGHVADAQVQDEEFAPVDVASGHLHL